MDKYGVLQDDNKTKTATVGQGCPTCGGKVERRGNVIACENCGTKPFEKKKESPIG